MAINCSEKIPNNVNIGLNEQGDDAPLYIPNIGLK
jgi:hypothetical protein